MKSTRHKVLGHRVRLAQGGWFVVRAYSWSRPQPTLRRYKHNASSMTVYRERTLYQLERSMRGLK